MKNKEGAWHVALAPAKVNLQLLVHERRADGYHELETTMLALRLADRVRARLTREGGVQLRVLGPCATDDIPEDASNLAHAAARAALAELVQRGQLGLDAGFELQLDKQIPSRSGLGGGSADAAATLWACEAAAGTDLGVDWRTRTLAALGSDTVFFEVAGVTGWGLCRGRGEIVQALPPHAGELWIALITPALSCPTGAVFAALDSSLRLPPDLPNVQESGIFARVADARAALFNQLEPAARAAIPGMVRWRDLLDRSDAAHFVQSGSGSSFFGLFDDPQEAQRILDRIAQGATTAGLGVRGQWITRPAGAFLPSR